MNGTIGDWLARWEWAHHEALYSTDSWPELLGLVGIAIAGGALALALRRPIDPSGARVTAALVPSLSLLAVTLLASFGLLARMGASRGPWPLALTVLALGTAAAALLGLALLRRASTPTLLAAGAGALLGLAPATHAAWLAVRSYPHIAINGSPHQHVGLSQEITGSLDVGGSVGAWRWVHASEVIDGAREGEHVVDLIAESGGERVRRPFTVHVGRELAPASLPLAQGNRWTYRVIAIDGAWEDRDELVRVEGRRTVGPLHLIELRIDGRSEDVYALDGELWLHRERSREIVRSPALAAEAPDGTQPEHLVPRSTPPLLFALYDLHCAEVAAPSASIELPGPTRCEGQRSEELSGGQIVAAIFTAGIAIPFMRTPTHPIRAHLIESRRGLEPAFELPIAASSAAGFVVAR